MKLHIQFVLLESIPRIDFEYPKHSILMYPTHHYVAAASGKATVWIIHKSWYAELCQSSFTKYDGMAAVCCKIFAVRIWR